MDSSKPVTVLVLEWVTGGGMTGLVPASWAAEGQAMRRAVAADFAALPGPGARVIVPLDSRLRADPGPWQIVRINGKEPIPRLIDLAGHADYTVVIAPETMGVLARLARDLEAAGARSLGCSAESIELTADKARLADWLSERGISTPFCRMIVPAHGLPRDFPYPAVLKPNDGAGSVDTFWIADHESMPAAAGELPIALLQPFHPGIPMSASFLVESDRRAWLVGVGRQRIVVQAQRITYQGGLVPISCRQAEPQLRKAVESVPGLRGFVGVDFLWEPNRRQATVLEINPRATTSFVGFRRLLPSGHLAQAWLGACGARERSRGILSNIAEMVGRRPPVSFDAEGNIVADQEGVLVP
jgi:predicted ATP-grasp superfamily ATP-dependent carboligase